MFRLESTPTPDNEGLEAANLSGETQNNRDRRQVCVSIQGRREAEPYILSCLYLRTRMGEGRAGLLRRNAFSMVSRMLDFLVLGLPLLRMGPLELKRWIYSG